MFAALRRAKLSALPRTTVWSEEALFIPETWLAASHSILFTGSTGDSANLWEVRLSPSDWQVVGAPRQLTFGTAVDVQACVVPDPEGGSRLVFASLSGSIDVWSLPLNASQGKAVGDIRRLTQDASSAISPDLSENGKKLVYLSRRSGNPDVWIKDLEAGTESAVTATSNLEWYPILSPDGSRVAYQVYEGETYPGGRYPIYVVGSGGGVPAKVCEDCGLTDAWSPDAKWILYSSWATPPQHIGLLDLASGKKTQLLRHSRYNLWAPRFSTDGRWIAFQASLEDERKRLFVARFQAWQAGQVSPAQGEWIDVTAGEYDSTPAWSPDGNLLYFTSERDGFRCIWARRLDPATKRPLGALVDVYHSHSARRSLTNVPLVPLRIAVSSDKIAFTLGELTGNIWAAKLDISWATAR